MSKDRGYRYLDPAALARLWEGPETLPRDGEIDAPDRWIARVLDGSAA